MKIAIVTPMAQPLPAVKGGGAEWLIQTIIDENEKNHLFDLTVISVADEQAEKKAAEYEHTKFVFIPKNRLFYKYYGYLKKIFGNVPYFLPYSRFLKRFFAKNHFDKIILENNIHLVSGVKKAKGQVTFHLHNDTVYPGAALPKGYERVERVLCVSNFIKSQVVASGAFAGKPVEVLPNCYCMSQKPDMQKRADYRAEMGIEDKDTVFLYTGRVIREKGVKELVQAFNAMDKELPARLLIVGGIKYSSDVVDAYLQSVKDISTESVIYTGYVDYQQIGKYYVCADVAVIPTLYVEEAASLAAIEAITCGLPVIAANSGGIWDYVQESCGRKVCRGDAFIEDLTRQMEKLAGSEELRLQMHENAQKLAGQFTKETYFKNFCNLMEKQ